MPRVRRQVVLEDPSRPVTPDMSQTKLIKTEYIDDGSLDELSVQKIAEETPSPHLQDHQYGQTPCYQVTRRPAPAIQRPEQISVQAVKRRLNLEVPATTTTTTTSTAPTIAPTQSTTFKAPRGKRRRSGSNSFTGHTPIKSKTVERTRYDTSLSLLTKKFINLVENSSDGVVDLNVASEKLEVQKRRIYDITNVLEGIGILEKKSKNNIQWKGGQLPGEQNDIQQLRREISDLEAKENELDRLIHGAEERLREICGDRQYAYVTYQDLRSVPAYKDQAIMAVKAPPEATLHVPQVNPDSGHPKLQIHMRSSHGEIEVFLCPDDPAPKVNAPIAKSSRTTLPQEFIIPQSEQQQQQHHHHHHQQHHHHHHHQQKQVNVKAEPVTNDIEALASTSGMRDALLCESDDFGPMGGGRFQLQTEDQNSATDINILDFSESLLALEPPLSENDYSFSLANEEGLSDLFDFPF